MMKSPIALAATIVLTFLSPAQESKVELLEKLGYDRVPDILNKYEKEKVFRMPTELECRFFLSMPTVPAKENASIYYLKAGAMVDGENAPPGSLHALDSYDGDFEKYSKWISKHKAAIAELKRTDALSSFAIPPITTVKADPFMVVIGSRPDISLGIQFKACARFICDLGFYFEEKGDVDSAMDHYLMSITLGNDLIVSSDTVISKLVGNALVAIGSESLRNLIGNNKLTKVELKRAQVILDGVPNLYPHLVSANLAEEKCRWEFILDREFLKEWVAYLEPKLQESFSDFSEKQTTEKNSTKEDLSGAISVIDSFMADLHEAADAAIKQMKAYIDAPEKERNQLATMPNKYIFPTYKEAINTAPAEAETYYSERGKRVIEESMDLFPEIKNASKDELEQIQEADFPQLLKHFEKHVPEEKHLDFVCQYHMARLYYPMLGSYAGKSIRSEIRTSCLRTRVALKRYHGDNDHYPKSLDELVPHYMKELPLDPYAGKPYIYKLKKNGWLLYSVGQNRKDDGGEDVDLFLKSGDKDMGVPSFVATNSQKRRGLERQLYDLWRRGITSRSAMGADVKKAGFVKYKGLWIKKEMAEKRSKREHKQ